MQAVVQDMALKWKKAHGNGGEIDQLSIPASDVEMADGPLLTPVAQKSTVAFVAAQAK